MIVWKKIKEEYKRPVIINSPLGRFELDKNYNWFKGQIDYLGENCYAYLEVDEGEIAADIQLNKLSEIYRELEKWDAGVKEFVSDDLLDLANQWLDDESEITKEEFIQRIGMPDITIKSDGEIRLMFDSAGIFSDHGIVAEIDKNGDFISTDIVG